MSFLLLSYLFKFNFILGAMIYYAVMINQIFGILCIKHFSTTTFIKVPNFSTTFPVNPCLPVPQLPVFLEIIFLLQSFIDSYQTWITWIPKKWSGWRILLLVYGRSHQVEDNLATKYLCLQKKRYIVKCYRIHTMYLSFRKCNITVFCKR